MNTQNMLGKYKGKRVAHVVDRTLGGKLCVVFGKLPGSSGLYKEKFLSIPEFASWCERYKAKRIEVYLPV